MLYCGAIDAGRPACSVRKAKGLTVLHLEGCIAAESVDQAIDELALTRRHVMIVVDSRGGWLDDAARLSDAISAAFHREIAIGVFISGSAHGAALLMAHSSHLVFADPSATVGNIGIVQNDPTIECDPAEMLARHRVSRDYKSGRLTIWEQSWFPPPVFLRQIAGLHDGRLVNAEAAECLWLVSAVCSFHDSVDWFSAVIKESSKGS